MNEYAPRGGAYERLDKERLDRLYTIECLRVSEIARRFDVTESSIRYALRLFSIPIRPSLPPPAKYLSVLKGLAVGESAVIECEAKNPDESLRNAARRGSIEILIEKIGENRRRVTRLDRPPRWWRLARIDRTELERLYREEHQPLVKISRAFETALSITITLSDINRALQHYRIPERGRQQSGGKHISLFRRLEIGERAEIECRTRHPIQNLHEIAKRVPIKISLRRRGNGIYAVTRIA